MSFDVIEVELIALSIVWYVRAIEGRKCRSSQCAGLLIVLLEHVTHCCNHTRLTDLERGALETRGKKLPIYKVSETFQRNLYRKGSLIP